MANLYFYASADDLKTVVQHLNADEEVAWLVADGPGGWIAKKSIDHVRLSTILLWHIPSGALPLYGHRDNMVPSAFIMDPWKGWKEIASGPDPAAPNIWHRGHFSVFSFEMMATEGIASKVVMMSAFRWEGNTWKGNGLAPPLSTHQYWKNLRKWIMKQSVAKLPRSDDEQGKAEIWTMKNAWEMIRNGAKRGYQ